MVIWVCIALALALVLLIVHSCMVVSGNISRQEEQKAVTLPGVITDKNI